MLAGTSSRQGSLRLHRERSKEAFLPPYIRLQNSHLHMTGYRLSSRHEPLGVRCSLAQTGDLDRSGDIVLD